MEDPRSLVNSTCSWSSEVTKPNRSEANSMQNHWDVSVLLPFPFLLGKSCRDTQYGSIWVQIGLLFEGPYCASPFSSSRYFCTQHWCKCFGGSQRRSILSCFAALYNMSSPTGILENCLYLMTVTIQVTGSIH